MRDLLALDIDVATLLPDDHHKTGYDTDAARLQVSPSYVDQYVNAARVVAAQAVGNPKAPAITTTYGNLGDMVISLQVRGHPGEGNQQLYRDGMPFGTRGGISGEYIFPADGDYALTIGDLAWAATCRSWNSITPSWHCWMARSSSAPILAGSATRRPSISSSRWR